MAPFNDLTGERFGRLRVSHWLESRGGHQHWLCICDCGTEVAVSAGNLLGGQVSCGCVRRERLVVRNTTHGGRQRAKTHPLYQTWQGMKKRCDNPNTEKYRQYGGRGITVCDRWRGREGFANFVADMGDRPSRKHSLDRINVDGDYEPSNCRWATATEQARNRRKRGRIGPLLDELDEYRRRYGSLDNPDPARLRAAADYLEKHRAEVAA